MPTVTRVVRAFFKALMMTLRGESVAPPLMDVARSRFPALASWCDATIVRVDAVMAAADAAGWTDARRAAYVLRIEGRDVSLKMMLDTVRFHCAQEIPHLLASDSRYGRIGAQALAINDHYWADRFSAADDLPEALTAALAALAEHLAALPSERPREAHPS